MSESDVLHQIGTLLGTMASAKGVSLPPITAETRLLGGELGIDSLDLASLVFELEQVTGHDPFKSGFVNFQTAGELAMLYRQ